MLCVWFYYLQKMIKGLKDVEMHIIKNGKISSVVFSKENVPDKAMCDFLRETLKVLEVPKPLPEE